MYQMPVRAIKNILKAELQGFKDSFYTMSAGVLSDVQKEMINLAYSELSGILEKSNHYNELEDYIAYAGYRMSLEEWINSL